MGKDHVMDLEIIDEYNAERNHLEAYYEHVKALLDRQKEIEAQLMEGK